jgi:hypothetical protein
MKDYVVWLRHKAKATLHQVTVRANSSYEAQILATVNNPSSKFTVARIYPLIPDDDDD